MKRDVLLDTATVIGCCVGVGFLSGKEAQLYFGTPTNTVIFALCFGAAMLLLRSFCHQNNCYSVAELSNCCFGKAGAIFTVIFLMCCFVSTVTMLAGVQNCLANLIWKTKLPAFSLLTAIVAYWILQRGLNALKILNAVSVMLALCYLIFVAATTPANTTFPQTHPFAPVKYALFSATMSLGVIAPLSQADRTTNLLSGTLSAIGIALLMFFVLCTADFSLQMPLSDKNTDTFAKALCFVSMTLCTVTGVAANTLPIVQTVHDVFDDNQLACALLLCLATAFSLFGFDFLLNYGYLFVAITGSILLVSVAVKSLPKRKIRAHKVSTNR